MADYYTQTAFAISVSEDEAGLVAEIVALLSVLEDGFADAAAAHAAYDATSAAFQVLFPRGEGGDPFFGFTALFDDPTWPTIGCDLDAHADPDRPGRWRLVVNGDDTRPFDLAALLQRICPSALPFRFGWAYTCSRHRIDAFGGGYMEVAADRTTRLIDPDDPTSVKRFVLAARDPDTRSLFWNSASGLGTLTDASVFREADAQMAIGKGVPDSLVWLELPDIQLGPVCWPSLETSTAG